MGPSQGGDWRAKLLVIGVVGIIAAGIYPTVVVPLQIAYGGAPRPERDPNLKPGFQKKSMWGSIDAAIKEQHGDASSSSSTPQQPEHSSK